MTTPDPITPERVTLTEAETVAIGSALMQGRGVYDAVERILSDRLRAAQADAWDEAVDLCSERAGVDMARPSENPYRGDET